MANDVNLKIGAEDTGLKAELAAAVQAVNESAVAMQESLAGVQDAFGKLGEAALAITSIMAGGKVFGEMVSGTVNLNVESMELGKQFGISATQASALKVALGATYLTQEQMSAAASRMTRTLNTNEGAFKGLGVATRDGNGNFRSTLDIMLDVNQALLQFKEGTDRNIEGTKIYGKGWSEVSDILRLTAPAMEEAKLKADELNLTVSQESEAATAAYRAAFQDTKDVLEGIMNTIGQAVMPGLTSLGEWFREIGPSAITATRTAMQALKTIFSNLWDTITALGGAFADFVSIFNTGVAQAFGGEPLSAMQLFTNALRVIEVAFIGLRTGVQLTIAVIENEFEYLVDLVQGWAAVIERAFHLDWAGVQAAWKAGNDKIEADEQAHFQRLVDIAQKSAKDMNEAVMSTMGAQQQQTPTAPPAGDKSSEGGADQFGKRLESWIRELDLEDAALRKQHEAELALYKEQEAAFGKAAGARIAIAEQEVAAQLRVYGSGSAQYAAAQKHLVEVTQQANAQLVQMANAFVDVQRNAELQQVDAQERAAQEKLTNGLITNNQLLALERQFEDQRYQLQLAAIQEKKALVDPTTDPVAYAQICAQIEALAAQHAARMAQIAQQGATQQDKVWKSLGDDMTRSMTQSLSAMIKGTETFSQGIRSLFTGMAMAVMQSFAQTAAKNIATMLEQAAVGKTIRAQGIMGDAEKAASGAYSAIAAIPYVGPFLAPAAAAAAFAATMAFSSAAEGFDIPAGVAPVTQLHPREMVLPEAFADVIRGLAVNGGGGRSSNFVINARMNDARGLTRSLMQGGALHQALGKLHGQFAR
jgi:hypothetical protein